jgi:8-hydroxy-5-deazaflavin:NADPH oxidoreductase
MKIGIIGAGNIGSNVARLFVESGNEVVISNSRGPETLQNLVAELGHRAKAVHIDDAAKFGDVVFVSIPFGKFKQLPAEAFAGKIVIDSNNYYPSRDGNVSEIDQGKITSSELLAAHLRGARVVKAFNTIRSEHLKSQGGINLSREDRRAIFIAGDDLKAKQIVSKLIDEIGFSAVDTGSLREGGKTQEPGSVIYDKTLTANEAESLLQKKAR